MYDFIKKYALWQDWHFPSVKEKYEPPPTMDKLVGRIYFIFYGHNKNKKKEINGWIYPIVIDEKDDKDKAKNDGIDKAWKEFSKHLKSGKIPDAKTSSYDFFSPTTIIPKRHRKHLGWFYP